MNLVDWVNSKLQNLSWFDVSLVKLTAAAFALMVAKLWPPLLGLAWWWYGLIFVIAAIHPMMKVFS